MTPRKKTSHDLWLILLHLLPILDDQRSSHSCKPWWLIHHQASTFLAQYFRIAMTHEIPNGTKFVIFFYFMILKVEFELNEFGNKIFHSFIHACMHYYSYLHAALPISISSVESQKGIDSIQQMIHWEPEGHYILLYKVYGENILLFLNGKSLNSINAFLARSQRYDKMMCSTFTVRLCKTKNISILAISTDKWKIIEIQAEFRCFTAERDSPPLSAHQFIC